jgi:hypothetical protein
MNYTSGVYMKVTTADRIKLMVGILQTAKKVSKYLPIIVFSYSALTLSFAVIDFLERYIAAGVVLSIFATFGIFLTMRILQTRRRGRKRRYEKYRNARIKGDVGG